MIRDLKLGIRMMRYCYRIKMALVSAGVFFCLGFLFLPMPFQDMAAYAASVYWMLVGLLVTGTLVSLNITAMVQSSPKKKALQTSVPAILNACFYLMSYIMFLLTEIVIWKLRGVEPLPGALIVYGLISLIYMVYCSYFKLFSVAVIFLLFTFLPISWGVRRMILHAAENMPLAAAAAIGLAEILLGAYLQYLFLLLTYRLPVSKMAIHKELKKQM